MGTISTPTEIAIKVIKELSNIRNKNSESGVQTEQFVYENAYTGCDEITDQKVRAVAKFAIKSLQEGYLLTNIEDALDVIEKIKTEIPFRPDTGEEDFEQRIVNMLVFNVLLEAWKSVNITNADLDVLFDGSSSTGGMKVVLNYLRGLPVDESQELPKVAIFAKTYLNKSLDEAVSFCNAINSETADDAIAIIAKKQQHNEHTSPTTYIEGLEEIYPDGAVLSVRKEPDGKSCEVLIVLRGSQVNRFGDWLSCKYGGNLRLGLLHDIKEHYGYHVRANLMYDKILEEVSRQVGNLNVNLTITGHSQGGALATLLARRFEMEKTTRINVARIVLLTFASPTPLRGDLKAYAESGIRHYRFIEEWDPAPEAFRLLNLDYCHFGAAIPIPLNSCKLWTSHSISTYSESIAKAVSSSTYVGNNASTMTPKAWTGEFVRRCIFVSVAAVAGYRNRHKIFTVAKSGFRRMKMKWST